MKLSTYSLIAVAVARLGSALPQAGKEDPLPQRNVGFIYSQLVRAEEEFKEACPGQELKITEDETPHGGSWANRAVLEMTRQYTAMVRQTAECQGEDPDRTLPEMDLIPPQ